ncbi:MAG: tetratricopeptide repeat protein [Alphaproteobacteria bacterium]|nr:tetratricopeptide repeat protein [Alphaproteobacteria bacterium]
MRTLSLIALCLPLTSMAGEVADTIKDSKPVGRTAGEKFYYQPGVVAISGVVEVPIFHQDPGIPGAYVEVTTGEGEDAQSFLMVLDPGASHVTVTSAFLKAAGGGEAKGKLLDGVEKHDVGGGASFHIGEVAFTDVRVFAEASGGSGPYPTHGVIGLHAFPELAAAILPSQGVVRFASADQASQLTSAVSGGVTLPYTMQDYSKESDGREKEWLVERQAILEGSFNGQPVKVAFGAPTVTMSGAGDADVEAIDTVMGECDRVWSNSGYGLCTATLSLGELGSFEALAGVDGHVEKYGQVWDFLLHGEFYGGWDIAYDPQAMTYTVAKAAEVKRQSWLDHTLEETLKGLEPDPETGEPPDAEAAAGTHASLAEIYQAKNDPTLAYEHARKAIDGTPDDCSAYLTLGSLHLANGDYEGAREPLRTAGDMYAAWAALPYDERVDTSEAKDKADKKEEPWTGPIPQSNSCHTAWGDLAEAELALGNLDAVIAIYNEHFDLDSDLAIVAGNAWLAQGLLNEAEAAYRQASRLLGPRSYRASLGLAMVRASRGDNTAAKRSFENAIWADSHGEREMLLDLRSFAATLARASGPDAAADALTALSKSQPTNPDVALAAAEAQKNAGRDAQATLDRAIALYEQRIQVLGDTADNWGGYAAALHKAGRGEDAKAAAEKALKVDARSGAALMTLADIASSGGDASKAGEYLAKAARAEALNPTMAPLLAR